MTALIEKYTYRTEWSDEDAVVIARCLEFPGLAAHGRTAEKAIVQIKAAVRDALSILAEDGDAPPEPLGAQRYSGRLLWRMGPTLHREVALAAAEEAMSINQFLNKAVSAQLRASQLGGQLAKDESSTRSPRKRSR